MSSRRVALDALVRIEATEAYANLALSAVLDRSNLSGPDRSFVTDLVFGTIRHRRACDFLVDRFLSSDPPPVARSALRLGAYQLAFAGVAVHAAVNETVAVAPKRYRSLVNAVLRKVAGAPVVWPDDATRLSYPDWIVARLRADLGDDDALSALAAMNEPAPLWRRDDGYVQDRSSQAVVEALGSLDGMLAADLCAAPGGKATAMATAGARVLAFDVRLGRAGLIVANVSRLGLRSSVHTVVADARHPPVLGASFDLVLLDAPCTGLGVLRRRPDARWRIQEDAVERLAALQREMLSAAGAMVRPGGTLLYSVCTLTEAETTGVAEHVESGRSGVALEPLRLQPAGWSPLGIAGSRTLPVADGGDGMTVFRWRRPEKG